MSLDSNTPRIVYMGTPEFAVAPLQSLYYSGVNIVGIVTVADKQAGRGRKLQQSPVKTKAIELGISILQPTNLKEEDFINDLRALNADLFVVVAFRMLPEQVWMMPRLGTFNLHGSLLPKYRGAAPIHWAVINGEQQTGLTTFLLDKNQTFQRIRNLYQRVLYEKKIMFEQCLRETFTYGRLFVTS